LREKAIINSEVKDSVFIDIIIILLFEFICIRAN
jgi:hypothetical protein